MAFFNSNSFQNKIPAYEKFAEVSPIDILYYNVDEIKLDYSSLNYQSKIPTYQPPHLWLDRNKQGGKMV